jgi:hypothetical protein
MIVKNKWEITGWLFAAAAGLWLTSVISSCGKAPISNPQGINIKYEVLNLSPDAFPLDLYIDFQIANTTPYTFSVNQGYFFLPSTDTPYLIRVHQTGGGGALLTKRSDVLKKGAYYSLFITGNVATNSLTTIFTVDTSSIPTVGRGKLRFVNASPTGTDGIDVYANGVKAFSKIVYPKFSDFIELPNGNYDLQINSSSSNTILQTLKNIQIQDGRLYTLYSYGYNNRIDSAAFNSAIITNR